MSGASGCRPPHPVCVNADLARPTQVLGNILGNAAKYTDPGGHIGLSARQEGGEAVVRARDTGIGIAAELLPRVFELFTQADQGPGRVQGGLGLGLALARRLVEMHGGSVEAHSEGPGTGSEFVVRLPVLEAASDVPAARKVGGSQPRRILLIEDNADVAEMLAQLLEPDGHQVVVAHEGAGGLRLAAEYRPEVVLLDIGLPGMDGYEVARCLRQEPALAGVTLVALTGYGHDEDIERSREAGFDHHVLKPADPETLQRILAL